MRLAALGVILFLSGVAGLGYQIAWTRMLAVGLGHELPGMLAVVGAFFGGLALGAWALDGPVRRTRHPLVWYAALEAVIGLWALATLALIPAANALASDLMGLSPSWARHWAVAFGVPLAVLLPATVAMGATLPAMERAVAPWVRGRRAVGGLYAANTAGAVLGTLASAFVLIPWLGMSATVSTLACVNLLCAAAVVPAIRQAAPPETGISLPPETPPLGTATPGVRTGTGILAATLLVTGALGIGFEAVGVRVLSQVLENTVYSFAATLAVYLTGTAGGAWLYQRLGPHRPDEWWTTRLLLGLALACLMGTMALSVSGEAYRGARLVLGRAPTAGVTAEVLIAAMAFALPTVVMGAAFSHFAQAWRDRRGSLGGALALNTLGGFVAPALFAVVLLPAIGARWTLTILALGYLLLIPKGAALPRSALLLPIVLAVLVPSDLRLVRLKPAERLVEHRQGAMASVSVVEHEDGYLNLRVNNRFQMGGTSSRAAAAELRQGFIPLLLHPEPRRALYLGLGTGITFQSAAFVPGVKADGVELVPEVVAVMPRFALRDARLGSNPDLRVYVADARRFIRATPHRYDVVVADLFHPARDGAGSLYTAEHFAAVRGRLEPGGVFVQWLPLFQLDTPELKSIVRTYLSVFPGARAVLLNHDTRLPALGLVGFADGMPPGYGPGWFDRRAGAGDLRRRLAAVGLTDDFALFGGFLAGPAELAGFAGAAPVNRDDHPLVTFAAPGLTYRREPRGFGRLLVLVDQTQPDLVDWVAPDHRDGPWAARLAADLQARDLYLLAQTAPRKEEAVELLLRSVAASPAFAPPRRHAEALARQQRRETPQAADDLLRRLDTILGPTAPARPQP